MKKLLLVGAILIGAATASQAGIRFHLGLPLPPLPSVVITPSAPVYSQPYCPPAYDYYGPSVTVDPYYYGGYGYYPYRHYYAPRYYGHHYYAPRYYGHYRHGRW